MTATNKDGLSGTASATTRSRGVAGDVFTSSPPAGRCSAAATRRATGGASGIPVVFSIDASSDAGVCVLDASGTTVSFTGAGTCVIDANQAGDADYDPAAQQQQSFTVAKGLQAIAFTSSPPSRAVFGGSYTPAATGGASGIPVLFSIDASSDAGVCVLDASGTTVSFTGAGTCVIDANQAGDADYDPAAQQQQSSRSRRGRRRSRSPRVRRARRCSAAATLRRRPVARRAFRSCSGLMPRAAREYVCWLVGDGVLHRRWYLRDRRQPGR